MAEDLRRAAAAFELSNTGGATLKAGQAEATIGDDSLNVGPVTISFLDMDVLVVQGHRIEINVWPDRAVVVSQLGRRFETFSTELKRARNRARIGGLLAHGITAPEVFEGALLAGSAVRPAELRAFDTHLTIVPADGDPFQIPLGTITDLREAEDPPRVTVESLGTGAAIGRLSRRRDEFHRALASRIAKQSDVLTTITGHDTFVDGRGVARPDIRGFEQLLARVSTPERLECARALLTHATGEPRLGFVQLLDPGDDGSQSVAGLPKDWASFLMVPAGNRSVVEMLAGPAAATYVFSAPVDAVNRDLQALHFRRAPIALTEDQAQITPFNPYRLALRKLEPLQRLRASTASRLIHNDGWTAALSAALVRPGES